MTAAKVQDKLAVNKFVIDTQVHILINQEICSRCEHHRCLYACPAECYTLEGEHITYSYEGCLEGGSGRIACDKASIQWILPRAGFGVQFQFG